MRSKEIFRNSSKVIWCSPISSKNQLCYEADENEEGQQMTSPIGSHGILNNPFRPSAMSPWVGILFVLGSRHSEL